MGAAEQRAHKPRAPAAYAIKQNRSQCTAQCSQSSADPPPHLPTLQPTPPQPPDKLSAHPRPLQRLIQFPVILADQCVHGVVAYHCSSSRRGPALRQRSLTAHFGAGAGQTVWSSTQRTPIPLEPAAPLATLLPPCTPTPPLHPYAASHNTRTRPAPAHPAINTPVLLLPPPN